MKEGNQRKHEFVFGEELEPLYITPEFMFTTNSSHTSQMRRIRWNEARKQGLLIMQKRCGDARTVLTEATRSVDVRAIAAGGPDEPYNDLINDPSIKIAVKLTHFDAEEFVLGEAPLTCGGLNGKSNGVSGEAGIGAYIEYDINHSDPILQACLAAEEASQHTPKTILAAVQDHISGLLYPVAVYRNYGRQVSSSIPTHVIHKMVNHPETYDPERIYGEGMPCLTDEELPDDALEFRAVNRMQVEEMKEKYPNLSRIKKVQDPGLIILSTATKPVVVRYAGLEQPGSFFEIRMPRRNVNGEVQIENGELIRALNQIEYPVTHATENYGQIGKPFARTRQLLIETGSIGTSRELAGVALSFTWMQNFMALPDTQIFTAQTAGGVLQDIDEYKIPA